ncbi:hypothetical protein LAZ67_8002700 [Cordylochernes scorpioides]|uniref:CCHC-type domain-containing protein n=1 Tax=Cordylochernes scorpioides TaxID=51811 RepID=A0ABY6KRM7_9ARAC|nr:hypothetical protein LAZ67_8002700 [Cordylochernes scorpioides]
MVRNILHEELRMRKICARWVPHLLNADQKQIRKRHWQQCLDLFKRDLTDFATLVTMDETWVHHYRPKILSRATTSNGFSASDEGLAKDSCPSFKSCMDRKQEYDEKSKFETVAQRDNQVCIHSWTKLKEVVPFSMYIGIETITLKDITVTFIEDPRDNQVCIHSWTKLKEVEPFSMYIGIETITLKDITVTFIEDTRDNQVCIHSWTKLKEVEPFSMYIGIETITLKDITVTFIEDTRDNQVCIHSWTKLKEVEPLSMYIGIETITLKDITVTFIEDIQDNQTRCNKSADRLTSSDVALLECSRNNNSDTDTRLLEWVFRLTMDISFEVFINDSRRNRCAFPTEPSLRNMESPFKSLQPPTAVREIFWIFQGLISTLQLVERLDRYPLRNKIKIDSVEPEETSMNVKKEDTQVSNYVVQHLPRNPSIFSGEDGEDLQKWLKGYARVARYNHWDETLCLTKVYFYLSGTALKWFENNEESIQTWKEFTSQLENVFRKKENSKLQAEKKLKTRAQLKGESTECYIQDLLCLCKEVDPQMSEEDKISHLMKGIAEELYQALLPRDVQSTEQFITECRRVEALRCRRVTPTRYERLPNVASLCDQDDGEDLSSLIRQIVREEVQRALGSPREEPKNATIEEIVKEEIGRTLAPISKSRRSPPQKERPRQFLNTRYEAETIRPHPEPRYLKQGGRRDTNDWRTTEGRPICFYCGRPGHVVRYCRDRKRHNEERRNDYFQRKQDAMASYNSRAESQDPNDESSRKTFTRYRSSTSYRGRNRHHFSPARRSSWTPRH